MERIKSALGIAALVLLLFARAAWAQPGELVVSAAASLTGALGAAKAKYEASHPGVKIITNFGASGALLKQMENGAPVDLFCAADQKTMDEALAKGLVDPASRRNFAKNALVLAAPAGAKAAIGSEQDLSGAGVARIALGSPETVPAGRYAKEFLTAAGLWGTLAPKFVYGENVRQVLDYLVRGEVDAGFVFATDAFAAGMKVRVVKEAPTNTPALYPLGIARESKNKAAARAFADFLSGPQGLEILRTYGFMKP